MSTLPKSITKGMLACFLLALIFCGVAKATQAVVWQYVGALFIFGVVVGIFFLQRSFKVRDGRGTAG